MTDVLVVGYGPAGAAAAIAAHDAGAEVLVVEKTAAGGGNARYSGGFLFDAPDPDAAEHVDALCFGRTPRDVIDAYVNGLHDLQPWLTALGGTIEAFGPDGVGFGGRFPASFPSWPSFPAGKSIRYAVVGGGEGRRGEALWRLLDAAVRERGIRVEHETRAVALLHGSDTPAPSDPPAPGDTPAPPAVTGAIVERDGERRRIAAPGGVILACGGFEGDPGLADAHLPLGPTTPVGHAANTGDGLRMAQDAGAALWHMYGFFGWFAFHAPGFAAPFAIDFYAPGHILVDADGRRFADETGFEVHDRLRSLSTYLPHHANRPRLPTWAIFDDATRRAGPLNGLLGTPNDHVWSADNQAEIDAGWIVDARDAGLPHLAQTIETYNSYARAGSDPDFHRDPETLTPLEDKLYAIPTWPGVAGTTGGPRHDARARVLDHDGAPIPGLYAAGAVSLIWGHLIDHGGGLTDAMVFGRIAGEQAAAR
ncbi:MAG TPA: FAD-binding protein [Baekduia sp.]|uniref:FAD-binding protein n=1 Tax=Baekduia sp. TaxID=2600305 RepID=UPI002D780CC0|nr:FAD-binding protein [Baekduia sp.]HET6506089.1 FAD-binding protein [Baekduia sp.]